MVKGPQGDKSVSGSSPSIEPSIGPARVEALGAVESILSDSELHISRSSEVPASIDLKSLASMPGAAERSDQLKGLAAMSLTALTADGYHVSMAACVRIEEVSKVLGPVSFSLATESGAFDVEDIGINNIAKYYPELAEWRYGEILKNPEANSDLTELAFNGMLGRNLAKAQDYARSFDGNYFGNPNLKALCERALRLTQPLPREDFTPTLTPQEQDDVKRLYSLGRRAIFDTDQATALAAIDQLAKEPVEFGVPLLVAATRYENEACQQAARAHIRNLAPGIADLLPDTFKEYSSRIAHFA